ncbi:hypothetical protein ACFQ0B_08295 [Nonomuraea thailandensis]
MITTDTKVSAMPSSHARNLGGTFSDSSCTRPMASHRGDERSRHLVDPERDAAEAEEGADADHAQ